MPKTKESKENKKSTDSDLEFKNKIEAILFSCGRKISYEEIAKLLGSDEKRVKRTIALLIQEYLERQTPLVIIEYGSAAKLTVKEQYLAVVRKINPETEMSKSLIETLAVIAWKNPCLQSDVIKIRTNKAYNDISDLESQGFITKEKKGRSFLIRLTSKFYSYFDLKTSNEITKLFDKFEIRYKNALDEKETQKTIKIYEPK